MAWLCREWWVCVISVATLWLNPAVCWQNVWLDSQKSPFSQPPTSLQEAHLVNWIKLICCLYRIYLGVYMTATHNTLNLHYRWLKLLVSAALSTCELVECCLQTVHRSQSSVTHLLSVHINSQSPAGIVHSCTSAQSAIYWPRFQQCVHSDDGTNRYNIPARRPLKQHYKREITDMCDQACGPVFLRYFFGIVFRFGASKLLLNCLITLSRHWPRVPDWPQAWALVSPGCGSRIHACHKYIQCHIFAHCCHFLSA